MSSNHSRLFGYPLPALLFIYITAECLFMYSARLLKFNGHDFQITAASFAFVSSLGSAALGAIFVATRRCLSFSIPSAADTQDIISRHPRLFAFFSGNLVGMIVFSTAYFFYSDVISTLEVALLLRSSVIIISWTIDQIHMRQGHLKTTQSWREHLAAITAIIACILITIHHNKQQIQHDSLGLLLALGLYVLAYSFRLHWMNRFKQLDLLKTSLAREAYFSWEQLGFLAIVILSTPVIPLSSEVNLLSIDKNGWLISIASGTAYFIAAIAGVSILIDPQRNATRAGLLTRLSALAAGLIATYLAYIWLDDIGPSPIDALAMVFFVTSCILLAIVQHERDAESNRFEDTFGVGVLRLTVILFVFYYILVRFAIDLKLVIHSPFLNELNLFALIGESALRGAIGILPFIFLIGTIYIIMSHRIYGYLKAAFGSHGDPENNLHPEDRGIGGNATRTTTAIRRLGWIVAVFTGALAFVAWVQDMPSSRLDITRYLANEINKEDVLDGLDTLRKDTRVCREEHRCPFCDNMIKLHESGTASSEDVAYCRDVMAAINLAETMLIMRRDGALSEMDFHSMWAAIADEICRDVKVHADNEKLVRDAILKYNPIVYERIKNLPAVQE